MRTHFAAVLTATNFQNAIRTETCEFTLWGLTTATKSSNWKLCGNLRRRRDSGGRDGRDPPPPSHHTLERNHGVRAMLPPHPQSAARAPPPLASQFSPRPRPRSSPPSTRPGILHSPRPPPSPTSPSPSSASSPSPPSTTRSTSPLLSTSRTTPASSPNPNERPSLASTVAERERERKGDGMNLFKTCNLQRFFCSGFNRHKLSSHVFVRTVNSCSLWRF